MIWQSGFYVYLMLAAGAVSIIIAFLTYRRRQVSGWRSLIAINLAGAFWSLTAALELASGSFENAILFHKLSFIGMESIPVAWVVFTARFAGRDHWATPKKIAILSALPVVTLILLATNGYHRLMFTAWSAQYKSGIFLLQKTPGVWWWIDSIYTYCLLLAGLGVLGVMFIREIGLYRRQVAALIAGLVVPMCSDLVYVSTQSVTTVNLTPVLFAWVGVALYWGFVRYQLLDVAPVAREFVTEHMSDALVVFDPMERVSYINPAAEELLGVKLEEALANPLAVVVSASRALYPLYCKARDSGDDTLEDFERGGRHYDGRVSALRDRRGEPRGSVLVLRDTTDRRIAEMALDEAKRDLERRVIERTAQLATEKEHLAHLNAVAVEIARCETSAELLEMGARLARNAVGAEGDCIWLRSRMGDIEFVESAGVPSRSQGRLKQFLEDSTTFRRAAAEGVAVCLEGLDDQRIVVVPLISRGQNLGALCLVSSQPGFGSDPELTLLAGAIASQIAVALENARRYEEAQFLAERDSLTLLLNHRGLSKRLEQEVALSDRSGMVFSLVMIDVDGFKLFNDAYGHVVGDRVLQVVAHTLNDSLRRSDIIGRYGGDEFVALLPDTDAESAVQLVERIRATLDQNPYQGADSSTIPLKMSYGIATFPYDGASAAEILAAADANLYRSKRRGGDFITASGSSDTSRPTAVGTFSVLDGLVTTVDKKDHYTRRHSDNVTEHTMALSAKMGLSLETQRSLRVAALLHDVGKLGVPDRILRKPAGLTEGEFETIKTHVTLGELIIQGIPNQQEVLSAVTTHHERFDGKGYPKGLSGNEIPLLGRMLAVTDAYSAMTVDRPYRKALSAGDAKAELKRVAGTQLDPQIVAIFLQVLAEDEATQKSRVAVFAHS